MAVTITPYNHTTKKLLNKEFDLTALKVMLLNNTAVTGFSAAHTTVDAVAGAVSGGHRPNEVYGNGWTEGGESLSSVAVTTVTTNDAMLDAADISKTASGGSIGPAEGALLFDDTNKTPIAMIDFGQSEEAGDTTDFKIIWPTGGIISDTV